MEARRKRRPDLMDIAVIVVLILTNGLFAMSELALLSSKPARLKARAEAGDKGATAALKLLDDPSRLLSTVQFGITLLSVGSGVYAATALADDLSPVIAGLLPQFAASADKAAYAIVAVAITYFQLIIGELVPKRIAVAAPELVASIAARPMAFLATVAHPAVAFLRLSTEGVVRLLGLSGVQREKVTEEEILHIVAEGATSGAIGRVEKEMIEGVLDLSERNVRSIMTPRTEVVWLDLDESFDKVIAQMSMSGHSRFPVAHGDIDRVVGIVQSKDVLGKMASIGRFDLEKSMRKPVFVPETLPVSRLFDALSGSEVRMAIALDEHGVVVGVVTAADMLGAIAGARAFSPLDRLDVAVRREDGTWLVDGMTPMEDFERLLGVKGLADTANYTTVAGLIMHRLQRIAQTGDRILIEGYHFEVIDMDGRRIDKLLVTPPVAVDEDAVI
jgi:putative hemolysin